MQRAEQIQPFQPTVDYNFALWQAYLNCVNSFQLGLELSKQGYSAETYVAGDRFEGNVEVLAAMILPEWKDDQYEKALEPRTEEVEEWVDDPSKSYHEYPPGNKKKLVKKKVPAYPSAIEKFQAITQLLHRKKFFQGEKVSLLP